MRFLLCSIILFSTFFAVAAPKITYHLTFPEAQAHYVHVMMEIEDPEAQHVTVTLPTWTPGSYLIREFSRNMETITAENGSGKQLDIVKLDKNTWRVATGGADEVQIAYRVYAYEMSVRTSFVDADLGYLNGTSIFMYLEGGKELPVQVEIQPYENWPVIKTPLNKVSNGVYSAENYDELVDHPIVMGNRITSWTFDAEGIEHEVVMVGEGNFDQNAITRDLTAIVRETTDVFGQNPLEDHYMFIVLNRHTGYGGLEHATSTSLILPRWNYNTDYSTFLSLSAHEYFHLWNVKRLRPESLGPFDYENEAYTPLLWFVEGFTSYYDELLLRRTKHFSENEYLARLSSAISSIENRPANRVQPVAESSIDAWVKYYRQDENAINSVISYYTKGAVIGAMLDLLIMHNSNGEDNLDDVMAYMYEEYFVNQDKPYTEADLKAALERFARQDLAEFYNRYIWGTETIPYNEFLSYAGLQLRESTSSTPSLNVGLRESNGLFITEVARGTAAFERGLNVHDEIVAINGYRIATRSDLNQVLQNTDDDPLQVVVAREGRMKEISLPREPLNRTNYYITKLSNLSQQQQKVYDMWMVRGW